MAATPSIARLKSRVYRKRVPSVIPAIDSLLLVLEGIKPSRRLPADVLSQYRSTIKLVRQKALHVQRRDARRDAIVKTIQWQRDTGVRLAHTRDLNATLAWLLNLGQQRNVHAVAHGKRIAAMLGRDHYVNMGKLGAAARWQNHRERQALLCLEDAHV
jgi:hypothetical protein